MNIGDGLTLQTRVIGGKPAPGIFLLENTRTEKRFPAKIKRTQSDDVRTEKAQIRKIPVSDSKLNKKGVLSQVQASTRKSSKNTIKIAGSLSHSKASTATSYIVKDSTQGSRKPQKAGEKSQTSVTQALPHKNVDALAHSSQSRKFQKPVKRTGNKNIVQVNTEFVTLTQDQLNTILSLVKKQQEIDVGTVLQETNKPSEKSSSENKGDDEGSERSVTGIKENESSTKDDNDQSVKSTMDQNDEKMELNLDNDEADKENTPKTASDSPDNKQNSSNNESTPDDPNKRKNAQGSVAGLLVGFGSRDREKSRLEKHRKQWLKGLDEQVALKKQQSKSVPIGQKSSAKVSNDSKTNKTDDGRVGSHPQSPSKIAAKDTSSAQPATVHETTDAASSAAVRTSFVLGEASPRDEASHSKKREDQQRWKDELDKQIEEQKKRKERDSQFLSSTEISDDTLWFRHFDTLKPNTQRSDSTNADQAIEAPIGNTRDDPTSSAASIAADINSASMTSMASGGARDVADSRGNYLRTMTSLLDPAQLDAMELRRAKQSEHRRAIAAQVEERKRQKEQEALALKFEEERAERKLEKERERLQKQYESERSRQHEMEKKRAKQTEELYQQMEEAKASALREKFEQRQRNLRNNGHDTSRLERAHQNVLESNRTMLARVDARSESSQAVPPIPVREMDYNKHNNIAVDASYTSLPFERQPVSIITNADQRPIKLEISLNSSRLGASLVETAVQTEQGPLDFSSLLLNDSDAETEYYPLPGTIKGTRRHEKQGRERTRQRPHQENNSNNNNSEQRSKRKTKEQKQQSVTSVGSGEKPKWGVGQKKNFVPASQRYVNPIKKRAQHDYDAYQRTGRDAVVARQERAVVKERVRPGPSRPPATDIVVKHVPQPSPRSQSPPVPAVRNRLRHQMDARSDGTKRGHGNARGQSPHRATSALSVTTEHAKYEPRRHSNSPVPGNNDYVEYRRSDVVLDPNDQQLDVNGDAEEVPRVHMNIGNVRPLNNEPNNEFVQHRSRQEKILREISILRQGLLLKQREVASYPAAMVTGSTSLNLLERTNESKQDAQ